MQLSIDKSVLELYGMVVSMPMQPLVCIDEQQQVVRSTTATRLTAASVPCWPGLV